MLELILLPKISCIGIWVYDRDRCQKKVLFGHSNLTPLESVPALVDIVASLLAKPRNFFVDTAASKLQLVQFICSVPSLLGPDLNALGFAVTHTRFVWQH